MKREISREEIHQFYDGILEEKERREIKEHITVCPICREELEYLKALKMDFRELMPVKLEDDFKQKLLSIGRKRNNLFFLIKDIITIVKESRGMIFYISKEVETQLKLKYSEYIIRWIFFC